LLLHALENGAAAVLEIAQVAEALFQRAELDVIEAAGGFLAVAGDEGTVALSSSSAMAASTCRSWTLRVSAIR
jgi:hypothetical protein